MRLFGTIGVLALSLLAAPVASAQVVLGDAGRDRLLAFFGDVDCDGLGDTVYFNARTAEWTFLDAYGSDQFLVAWSPAARWLSHQVADVNGDGCDDVLAMADEGRVGAWWVTEAAPFGGVARTSLWGHFSFVSVLGYRLTWRVSTADYNGDGRVDLIGVNNFNETWAGISTGRSFVNYRIR
jgi:hypothetical protein